MDDLSTFAADRIRPLIRVRQIRDFADRRFLRRNWTPSPTWRAGPAAAVTPSRGGSCWCDSGHDPPPGRGRPAQTRALQTATAAIAIVLPDEAGRAVSYAYDEGRAAERILIAASMLGLGAGITWILPEARDKIHSILAIPEAVRADDRGDRAPERSGARTEVGPGTARCRARGRVRGGLAERLNRPTAGLRPLGPTRRPRLSVPVPGHSERCESPPAPLARRGSAPAAAFP